MRLVGKQLEEKRDYISETNSKFISQEGEEEEKQIYILLNEFCKYI